jgi:hypothetical protein
MKKLLRGYEAKTAKLIYWYAFLRLSRSYSIATAYAEGKLAFRTSKRMVPDLDLVLQTYSNFGNVWKKNPLDWLTANSYEIGGHLKTANTPNIVSILSPTKSEKKEQIESEFINFLDSTWMQSGYEPSLVVSIPLKIKKVNLHEFLKQALEQHEHLLENVETEPQQLDQFQMMSKKVRMDALEKSYNLVLIEAQNPEFAEWQLAECLGVCNKSVKAIKQLEADKAQGITKEDYGDEPNYDMSIHTVLRRYRRYAYLLAENAARGQFPLNDEKARKGRGEKVIVKFASKCISQHTGYLSRQLQERDMPHQYANEFLMRDAGINRKREKEFDVPVLESREAKEQEEFLRNRRVYAPLPKINEDEK